MMGKMTLRGPDVHRFPAFIWIYLISMGLFYTRCTAEELPAEFVARMKNHFCNCNGISDCDSNMPDQRCPLCQQICDNGMGHNPRECWSATGNICRNETFDTTFCRYGDAVVCRYASDYCVFRFCSDQVPLCTGSLETSFNSNPQWARYRQTCRQPIGSTTEVNLMNTENDQSTRGPSNAATIALACVLSIVLLLVILGAGVWYLRRRGKLPAFMKKNRNPSESATELEVRAGERAPIPTPPALGSAEYSYAYGQRPDTGGAKPMNKDDDEYHYYSSLDKDGRGEESARHVKDGSGSVKVPSTEAPSNHDYLVLENTDDHTYFPLQKMPERPSGNANSGYEVAKTTPTGDSEGEEASSP